LSSSAALEVAVGFALLKISEQPVDLVDLALACQRAEREFAGKQCGVMDQYIACLGIEDHALLIDCRSLEYRAAPIDLGEARIVVCDSMVKHDLASGEYNQRRAECEEGVRRLSAYLPGIRALRDVELEEFDHYADSLPDLIRRRSNHVITENARTMAAVAALERNDLTTFGQLMYASHESLRDDYEVSCRELDLLAEIASRQEGVFGSRMTGGGFGGCTVSLIASDYVERFITTISREYELESGVRPDCYVCRASAGVREEESVSP
jgi:galactokinase